jgi:hypothetical protein
VFNLIGLIPYRVECTRHDPVSILHACTRTRSCRSVAMPMPTSAVAKLVDHYSNLESTIREHLGSISTRADASVERITIDEQEQALAVAPLVGAELGAVGRLLPGELRPLPVGFQEKGRICADGHLPHSILRGWGEGTGQDKDQMVSPSASREWSGVRQDSLSPQIVLEMPGIMDWGQNSQKVLVPISLLLAS